ncbi:MAG TPA: hypothetical protein VHP83_26185 [Aggregatilineaceae bacterium]|nr:hypothetical protein [Aggregatilineaceae bacterium]
MASPQPQASFRKGFVAGEFLTDTYRISGEVELRGTPILDQLNDHMELFLPLENLFISPLLDPAVLTGNYRQGNVRKSNLGLVVLNQMRDGLPYREGQYMGRDNVNRYILIVAAGFEIQGALRLHPSVNVANFVRTTPEQFIPVFEGTALLTARRDVQFKGGSVLVNRNLIEVFCTLDKPPAES